MLQRIWRLAVFGLVLAYVVVVASDGIRILHAVSLPGDSSRWIAASTNGNNQIWLSQSYVYLVRIIGQQSFSVLAQVPVPSKYSSPVAATTDSSGPLLVISPYSTPFTLLEVKLTQNGYKVQRSLSIPTSGFSSPPKWQQLLTNQVDLPSALYLFSIDHVVIIDYNALVWSVRTVAELPQGQYPTQQVRATTFDEWTPDEMFLVRANLNATQPGEVLEISTQDGTLRNRAYLDRSPNTIFAAYDSRTSHKSITWAEGPRNDSAGLGTVYTWDLTKHQLSTIPVNMSVPQEFGKAFGVTSTGKYALLAYGTANSTAGYDLVSLNLETQGIMDTASASGTVPELGLEVGGLLDQSGLVLFGNRDDSSNMLTMIYYASWY